MIMVFKDVQDPSDWTYQELLGIINRVMELPEKAPDSIPNTSYVVFDFLYVAGMVTSPLYESGLIPLTYAAYPVVDPTFDDVLYVSE